MTATLAIKILTTAALTGLLFATGLRLTFAQIGDALRDRALLAQEVRDGVITPEAAARDYGL